MDAWLLEWGQVRLAGWTGFPEPSAAPPLSFENRVRAQKGVERRTADTASGFYGPASDHSRSLERP